MTRREMPFLLAAAAVSASAATERPTLPAKCYRFDDLPVKKNGENVGRNVFDGLTQAGFQVDLHETELGPGMAPHAPHRHIHEEIILIREGVLEVMIEGKTTTANPGSVVYVASNEFHGWKNPGTSRTSYFVLAVGRET